MLPLSKTKRIVGKNNIDLEVTKFGYFCLAVLHLRSEKIIDDDLSLCMFSMAFCINLFNLIDSFDSFLLMAARNILVENPLMEIGLGLILIFSFSFYLFIYLFIS
jgi:hypothetical protein